MAARSNIARNLLVGSVGVFVIIMLIGIIDDIQWPVITSYGFFFGLGLIIVPVRYYVAEMEGLASLYRESFSLGFIATIIGLVLIFLAGEDASHCFSMTEKELNQAKACEGAPSPETCVKVDYDSGFHGICPGIDPQSNSNLIGWTFMLLSLIHI